MKRKFHIGDIIRFKTKDFTYISRIQELIIKTQNEYGFQFEVVREMEPFAEIEQLEIKVPFTDIIFRPDDNVNNTWGEFWFEKVE